CSSGGSSPGPSITRFSRENRVMLGPGELPPLLQQAIIAAEDSNFYKHGGVDLKGIVRAVVNNLREGRRAEGASTLTMQLARTLFLTREKNYKRKIEEAFLAVELEKQFSKQQILTLYCNLMNLGHGNYGMEAAARSYFGKSVDDLTLPEAATLAGIPQRPTDLSPHRNPENVTRRRNHVLRRMRDEGYATPADYEAAVATPLTVVPRQKEAQLGPYFAEEVRRDLADRYGTESLYDQGLQVWTTLDPRIQTASETALREGLARLAHRAGWQGPLRQLEGEDDPAKAQLTSWGRALTAPQTGTWYEGVVLASDPRTAEVKIGSQVYTLTRAGIAWTKKKRPSDLLQPGDVAWFRFAAVEDDGKKPAGTDAVGTAAVGTAEAAAAEAAPTPRVLHLEQAPEMEGAVLVVESATGAIRAMIGGFSYERNEFNRATQARRQIGSAFKAFVFGAALENGFTTADTLFDAPAVFRGADNTASYSPRNYYRRYYGIITLRRALELSVNVSAVKLHDLVGAERVIDFAARAGIVTALQPYPSLALGAADLTPLELAASYATLANQGIHVEPYLIERVATPQGRVLHEHLPQARKAMDPQIAYLVTQMLQGVVDRGTAGSLRAGGKLTLDLAGKTGTTNAYTDAWFVGYTPRYTILSWVGYDKKRSLGRGMTGAEAALPIWKSIVQAGVDEGWIGNDETFPVPPGISEVPIEYFSGKLSGPGAERVLSERFLTGSEPQERYDARWAQIMALPWYQQEAFYLPKEGEAMPTQIEGEMWQAVDDAWTPGGRKKRAAERAAQAAAEAADAR
ncbi:MAG: PBP1A family penicillin-binding protein, partial [Acidobacteriota bacterium]